MFRCYPETYRYQYDTLIRVSHIAPESDRSIPVNTRHNEQTAEVAERHSRLLLLGVLFLALKYAASASMSVSSGALHQSLDYIELALALAGVGLIIPVCIWKLVKLRAMPTSKRILYFAPDSFAVDAINRAQRISWASLFITLIILEIISDKQTRLPAVFYLQVSLAVMLGVFAGAFFSIYREHEETEDATNA